MSAGTLQLAHGDGGDWAPLADDFRAGGKLYQTLLTGPEGTPDNYRLVVVRQTGSSGEWQFEEYLRRACATVINPE